MDSNHCSQGSSAPGAGAAGAETHGCHDPHHNPTSDGNGLKPSQKIALEHLFAGMTVTKAAKAAGVDRTTVHRWLRDDHAFQAAYNAAQRDLRRELETRLPHLAEAALETVQEAVRQGDVRAALAVLKGVGTLPGSPPSFGSDDREELAEDQRMARQEQDFQRSLRSMLTR